MKRAGRYTRWAAIALVIVGSLFPFLWMLSVSLKRQVDIFGGPSLPKQPTLSNYTALFTQFGRGMAMVVALLVLTLLLTIVAIRYMRRAAARTAG